MELRQLRYFVAVAEEKNISRAAQKIFLTQSALSRQIKALEEELGEMLLERQAHSIQLTPFGERMLPEARALLLQADTLADRVRLAGNESRLRIAYAPSLAAGILSAAVANFTQKHEGTRVEMFDLSTNEILRGLEKGDLDAALSVGFEGETRGLTWVPLLRLPLQLALHRNHPLAKRTRITPTDLAGEPLLVYCKRDYPEYWERVSEWFRQHQQRPRVAGEFDGVDSLMSAIESEQGVAIVATRKGRLIPDSVRLRSLHPSPAPLCVAVGHHTGRKADRQIAVFIEELRHCAGNVLS